MSKLILDVGGYQVINSVFTNINSLVLIMEEPDQYLLGLTYKVNDGREHIIYLAIQKEIINGELVEVKMSIGATFTAQFVIGLSNMKDINNFVFIIDAHLKAYKDHLL